MKLIFASLFFIAFNPVLTVEYLTVNHITKELFWAETDSREEGFIGWKVIPERNHNEDLQKYLALGYSYTRFPYKLDVLAGILLLLPLLIQFVRRKRRHHRSKN